MTDILYSNPYSALFIFLKFTEYSYIVHNDVLGCNINLTLQDLTFPFNYFLALVFTHNAKDQVGKVGVYFLPVYCKPAGIK